MYLGAVTGQGSTSQAMYSTVSSVGEKEGDRLHDTNWLHYNFVIFEVGNFPFFLVLGAQ